MKRITSQPRRVPPPAYMPRPYVFTLERRADSSSAYQPWAIAVIDLGAADVAVRVKSSGGAAHPLVRRHPLVREGAERFFSEDLPQLGRVGSEVTRNTPSVHFVLTEIQTRFGATGIAVFRGRAGLHTSGPVTPDESIQQIADAEFETRADGLVPIADEAIPRS